MADKDVRLIIRAKNDASKAINSVSDAMKVLKENTEDAGKSSGKADGLMGRLAASIKKLNSQTAAMDALGKVGGFVEKASVAVASLRKEVDELNTQWKESETATKAASASVAELKGRLDTLKAAYDKQRAAEKAARAETQRSSEAAKALTKANRDLAEAKALSAKNPERAGRIESATVAVSAAKAMVAANKEALEQAKAVSKTMKAEIDSLDGTISAAEKSFRQLGNETDKFKNSLDSSIQSLARGEAEMKELSEIAGAAAANLGVADSRVDGLGASLRTLGPQVDRAAVALAGLMRYSGGKGQFVDPKTAADMRKVRTEIERSEDAYKSLQAIAAQLARSMGGNGTAEQVAEFKNATAAARAAKNEMAALNGTLASLQNNSRMTFAEFAKARMPLEAVAKYTGTYRTQVDALNAALARYQTGNGGIANAQSAAGLRSQGEAVALAQSRYKMLTEEVRRLSSQFQAAGGATVAQARHLKEVAAAANQAEQEFKEASAALGKLEQGARSGVFGNLNRESRQSMSIYQRLRGEILALATAYVGFYGAIQNTGAVIAAYQKLEAAQNRLGVVFKQNGDQTRGELLWLERQAARLGIAFGDLADQYSKFAVSADAAGFSGENIRKIFLGIAEAGRVNKLSLEDMNGIFLAVTQMIQKGKISAEELRQQLGERLPGAVNILADALGITTAELSDMMQKGEILASETNLLKFADELNKRFGPQLAASLRSTTTLVGKWGDNVYQAQLRVAEGGFIEGFNDLLETMNEWFKSREGRDFFLSIGAAAGKAFSALALLPENLDMILTVVQLIVAVKVAAWLTGMAQSAIAATNAARGLAAANGAVAPTVASIGTSLGALQARTVTLVGSLANVQTRLMSVAGATRLWAASTNAATLTAAAGSARVAILSGAVTTLNGVLSVGTTIARAFWVAVGGWVGVIATAVTLIGGSLLSDWLSGVDETVTALDEHKRLMGEILTEYDKVTGKAKNWADILRNMTLDQLDKNVSDLETQLDKVLGGLGTNGLFAPVFFAEKGLKESVERIDELKRNLREGYISAKQFRVGLEAIYSGSVSDSAKKYIQTQLEIARKAEAVEKALSEARSAADKKRDALNGVSDVALEAKGPLDELGEAVSGTDEAFTNGAASAEVYQTSLEKIKSFIPGLAVEMKKLKDLAEIRAQFGMVGFNGITPDMARAGQQAVTAVLDEADAAIFKEIAGNTKVSKKLFEDIFGEESFRSQAYDDGYGTQTIGYGSTRVGGRAVVEGQTITKEDGMRQAIADLDKLIAQINAMVKVSLSDSQLRALASYAYNAGIGSLARDGILAPLNKGDYAGAQAAIRNGVTTSKGVEVPGLKTRRGREADMFAQGMDDPAVAAELVKQNEKLTEEKTKQAEATAKTIADGQFEIEQQNLKNAGKERQAAIEAAIREAKADNPNIEAAELETIRKQAAARFDAINALTMEEEKKKQIKDLDEKINLLESQRNGLLEQRKIYSEQGNTEEMARVDGELAGVNVQLQEAINNAIAFHNALGGEKAAATVAQLNATKLAIANTNLEGQKFAMTADQMSQSIAQTLEGGILNMFDAFASAIANGEDAMDALKTAFLTFAADFLRQIAMMILKQTMFNAIQSIGKALGGGLFSFTSAHSGGVIGSSGVGSGSRAVSPAWFSNAVRYHTGGIAGLAPDEVPTVLREGEEVLTETDSRHRKNGGTSPTSIKSVLLLDEKLIPEAMSSSSGEQVTMATIKKNIPTIRSYLGQ